MTFHKFIDSLTEKLISLGYCPKGITIKYFYFENFVIFFIYYENCRMGILIIIISGLRFHSRI